MRSPLFLPILCAAAALAVPAQAISPRPSAQPAFLQCVPFARDVTGIRIFGDAHTWWDQAAGRYARGSRPKVGAVMNFRPHRNSRLGHVAAVTRIVDDRTVLVSHANWSEIDGQRGQIERNVRVVDVSDDNDWSAVRVWYGPAQALGSTHWPLYGFIYKDGAPAAKPGRKARPDAPDGISQTDDPIGDIIRAAHRRQARR